MKKVFIIVWKPLSILSLLALIIVGAVKVNQLRKIQHPTAYSSTEEYDGIFGDNSDKKKSITFLAPDSPDGATGFHNDNVSLCNIYESPILDYADDYLVARLSVKNKHDKGKEPKVDKDGNVQCTMSGPHFDDGDKRNVIKLTEKTYNDIFKPLQDSIYNYINASGNDIMYSCKILDRDEDGNIMSMEVQGLSIQDTGVSCHFYYFIVNAPNSENDGTHETEE